MPLLDLVPVECIACCAAGLIRLLNFGSQIVDHLQYSVRTQAAVEALQPCHPPNRLPVQLAQFLALLTDLNASTCSRSSSGSSWCHSPVTLMQFGSANQ